MADEKTFVNPRNSAGEWLFYEAENVFDKDVEGEVINGSSNGIGVVPLKE